MNGIPIIIGVTGHRDLRPQDEEPLYQRVCKELRALQSRYPHSEFRMLVSLAAGADQLCARAAQALSIPILAALPMALADYEADFAGSALTALTAYIAAAADVFVVPDTEGRAETTRDYAYRQAGIYVARHCHVLLALWNGLPGTPLGCGTAEAVGFVLRETYKRPASRMHTPEDGAVLQIVTPRQSCAEPPADAFSAHLHAKDPAALYETLRRTDAYNADARTAGKLAASALFDGASLGALDARTRRIHAMYGVADTLALRFRNRYISALLHLSATGVLLMLAFLLHDEAESNLFLLVYAFVALFALCIFLQARHGNFHRKYLEYRFLAELLRVQTCLSAGGVRQEAASLFTRAQAAGLHWVHDALQAACIGAPSSALVDIERGWIDDQLAYHTCSLKHLLQKLARQHRISGGMMLLSVLFFLLVCVLEFVRPIPLTDTLTPSPGLVRALMLHDGASFGIRSLLNILLGIIPAITLFTSSYYGKLSLARKYADSERMIALFAEAKQEYATHPEARASILTELAREEIAEAGDWLAYCADNELDILL